MNSHNDIKILKKDDYVSKNVSNENNSTTKFNYVHQPFKCEYSDKNDEYKFKIREKK